MPSPMPGVHSIRCILSVQVSSKSVRFRSRTGIPHPHTDKQYPDISRVPLSVCTDHVHPCIDAAEKPEFFCRCDRPNECTHRRQDSIQPYINRPHSSVAGSLDKPRKDPKNAAKKTALFRPAVLTLQEFSFFAVSVFHGASSSAPRPLHSLGIFRRIYARHAIRLSQLPCFPCSCLLRLIILPLLRINGSVRPCTVP